MWRRCRGLPVLVESPAELSLPRSPSLLYIVPAEPRASGTGLGSASQAQHLRRLLSCHALQSHATTSQLSLPSSIDAYGAWGRGSVCECRSGSHWTQARACQTLPDASSTTSTQRQELPAAAEEAVLMSNVTAEGVDAVPSESLSSSLSEAQPSHWEEPVDVFQMAAVEATAEQRPSSALESDQSFAFSQPPIQPKHGRPSHAFQGDETTQFKVLERLSRREATDSNVASLEQGVQDPGGRSSGGWEDFVSMVRARQEAATAADGSLAVEGGVPQEAMETRPRGSSAVRRMQSWKEMADWLREYSNHWFLKASEISRMWTQIVQLHMDSGRLGRRDERKIIYPEAPFFSPGGRQFLRSLTWITRKRLQLTMGLIDATRPDYWENCRVRAPDAGRMMWAMGKLQWQSEKLLRLLEAAAVEDINCEWNRPRYMTTALWGSAWSAPGVPLKKLCNALQKLPDEFWRRGTNAQNVCNMAWAMSVMRFRPSEPFADFLQYTLQDKVMHQPRTIHPQNIGDMVQAVAVVRREPHATLLQIAERWMRSNVRRLLPQHIIAYLNGLGLMRKLTAEQYKFFAEAMEVNMHRVTEVDRDVFAQRVFVLRRLVSEASTTQPQGASSDADADAAAAAAGTANEPLGVNEFLSNLEERGRTIVQNMLLHSAKLIEQDDSNMAVRSLLASIGYDTAVAPREAALQDTAAQQRSTLTPLLPELYVRARQEGPGEGCAGADEGAPQSPPYVALQLIRDNDCFCNVKSRSFDAVLGETALVRDMLRASGRPVAHVFVEDLLALPSVEAMQAALQAKLQPLLAPGPCGAAPALAAVQVHGPEGDDAQPVDEVPVIAAVIERRGLLHPDGVASDDGHSDAPDAEHEDQQQRTVEEQLGTDLRRAQRPGTGGDVGAAEAQV